ncbi:MAG: trigger factor [Bdellovibrionota bacterium]
MSNASNIQNIEEVNATRRKINISVAASSVQDALSAVANEMQSTSEIRGFRKGKAPLTMVRKFYMNDIVKKAADKIINDAYSSVTKELDFQIVSSPHIEPENQFSENNEFKFSATVDINPKIEIQDYKNLNIKFPQAFQKSIDEQYETFIGSYQKSFAQKAPSQEDNAEQNSALPELNDEFAKRLGYENMEIAKTKICETLEQTHTEMKVNFAFEQIVDQVLAKNDFEVAESLVDSTINNAIAETNAGITDKLQHINSEKEDQRAKFREVALKNVRGILALGHIARQEGIVVTDDEMYRDLINYSMSNRIDPRMLFKKNGAKIVDEFRGQAMIRKVVTMLIDHAQIEYTKEEEKNSTTVE